ncbi:MAG: superinfection immunity protein [Alphaproteobacteria bacterium]
MNISEILLIAKYAACVLVLLGLILAPAWVARQNGKGKPAMHAVRLGSWIFGWSLIGWIYALYQAIKK